MRARDLTGKEFGKLTVLEEGSKGTTWLCKCRCGNLVEVAQRNLKSGYTASCGCTRRKHGMSEAPVYHIWEAMIQRCTNPNNEYWSYYGGRGIEVCDEWRSFQSFYNDMGQPLKGFVLDRIDNDLGYFKENCRWTTWSNSNANKRR